MLNKGTQLQDQRGRLSLVNEPGIKPQPSQREHLPCGLLAPPRATECLCRCPPALILIRLSKESIEHQCWLHPVLDLFQLPASSTGWNHLLKGQAMEEFKGASGLTGGGRLWSWPAGRTC